VFTHHSLNLVRTCSVLVTGERYPQVRSTIVLLLMIIFVASYSNGLGNVCWEQGEFFGLEGAYTVTFLSPSLHLLHSSCICLYFFQYPWSGIFSPVRSLSDTGARFATFSTIRSWPEPSQAQAQPKPTFWPEVYAEETLPSKAQARPETSPDEGGDSCDH